MIKQTITVEIEVDVDGMANLKMNLAVPMNMNEEEFQKLNYNQQVLHHYTQIASAGMWDALSRLAPVEDVEDLIADTVGLIGEMSDQDILDAAAKIEEAAEDLAEEHY